MHGLVSGIHHMFLPDTKIQTCSIGTFVVLVKELGTLSACLLVFPSAWISPTSYNPLIEYMCCRVNFILSEDKIIVNTRLCLQVLELTCESSFFRHCFISADFVQVILDQGCTIPWYLCTMVSKFCMLESNIFGVLIIEHVSCHPSGTQYFEVAQNFYTPILDIFICPYFALEKIPYI